MKDKGPKAARSSNEEHVHEMLGMRLVRMFSLWFSPYVVGEAIVLTESGGVYHWREKER